MKYSEGLDLVEKRARFLRASYKDTKMKIEYYFYSLLIFARSDTKDRESMASEIQDVKRILEKRCMYALDHTEQLMRKRISDNAKKLALSDSYFKEAEQLAVGQKKTEVTADLLLQAILKNPTFIIAEFVNTDPFSDTLVEISDLNLEPSLGSVVNDSPEKLVNVLKNIENQKQNDAAKAANVEALPKLVHKVSDMVHFLCESIKGQDHAVRAFAEGYFDAEVLSNADKNRKRPKATFLLAGPPGVGKTLLAEKVAEYLKLPYLCIDMSSCSDHQLGPQVFQGIQNSFKSAKPGIVTDFVAKNPMCVLLFDEMEKAHMNTLYLFYQMLDRGILKDLNREKDVSFKDAIIIMTTNTGHNLYEGKEEENLSLIPTRVITKALKKDINPLTNEPFFPEALVSRMASGTVLMFNHLKSHNLQEIAQAELNKNAELFKKQYGIEVTFDSKVASLLLYKEGGIIDARTLAAQSANFFKSQILQCVELFNLENAELLSTKFNRLNFVAENWDEIEKLDNVFKRPQKQEIVLFGNDALGYSLEGRFPEYSWNITSEEEQAFDIFSKKDIHIILLDLITREEVEQQKMDKGSIFAFDKMHISSEAFAKARSFIEKVTERFPEVPVYLLDRNLVDIDEQLEFRLIQMGVRAKIDVKDNKVSTYAEQIEKCMERSHLQTIALFLQTKHNMVKFQVSPYLHESSHVMDVRCRNYELAELIDAEDQDFLVADSERPSIKFKDVVGAGSAKEELQFFIDYLKNPKQYLAKGLKPPKGILFYGPPGTGKTMLAKAMAGESDITFISETASNFVTSYVGSGPAAVRKMFERARRYAPAILFIDEIDAIGRTRTGGPSAQSEETTLNTLLTEMDGFKVDLKRPVFIIAATNFKVDETRGGQGYIDPALVRRFDRKILIDLPNKQERFQLLEMLCKKAENCCVSKRMLENIAGRSIGLSNAILSNVVSQAIRMAQRNSVPLTDEMFEEAFETTVHGEAKDWGQEMLERVAWHESGHAYMYWKNGNVPSYLTIVARGDHGGYMQKNDKDVESPLSTREELLNSIRVSLAGRACEILRYGKDGGVSTGISGDLRNATNTAKKMICTYGMDDEIGMVYIEPEMANNSEMAMMIHKKTVQILNQQMEETMKELSADRKKIERLVRALLNQNSMTGEEIDAVLRGDDDSFIDIL